jgi:hypothetical protein
MGFAPIVRGSVGGILLLFIFHWFVSALSLIVVSLLVAGLAIGFVCALSSSDREFVSGVIGNNVAAATVVGSGHRGGGCRNEEHCSRTFCGEPC